MKTYCGCPTSHSRGNKLFAVPAGDCKQCEAAWDGDCPWNRGEPCWYPMVRLVRGDDRPNQGPLISPRTFEEWLLSNYMVEIPDWLRHELSELTWYKEPQTGRLIGSTGIAGQPPIIATPKR